VEFHDIVSKNSRIKMKSVLSVQSTSLVYIVTMNVRSVHHSL